MNVNRKGRRRIMQLSEKLKSIIGDKPFTVDEIGMSNSQVICFDNMVLKIEKQSEESNNEVTMMNWLKDKLPVPEILHYEQSNNMNYLLMSRVDGEMLCSNNFNKLFRPL